MNQFKRTWFIALKELKLFVVDRTALFFFVLFPFFFIILFNFLLADVVGEDEKLALHMTTLESGGIAEQIIESLETKDENLLEAGEPLIVWYRDYNQAVASVESGEIDGLLIFPEDFTRAIMLGYGTDIEILSGPDSTETTMALQSVAEGIISRISAQQVEINAIIALLIEQNMGVGGPTVDIQSELTTLLQGSLQEVSSQSLISIATEEVGDVKPYNTSNFILPGYLVMFVFFAAALSSESIVKERNNHTLERLLASSVNKEAIIGGIYLGAMLRGLVQIAIFWTVGILVFKIDLGLSPWAVILVSLLMVIMSAAFSVMLATLAKTQRSAGAIGLISSLLLAPLGGCWWPLFITPDWMQFLARLTPHGWANAAFNKLMLFGATGETVIPEMLALIGFTILFLIIAAIQFRTSAEAT